MIINRLILLLFVMGSASLSGQSGKDLWQTWENESVDDSLRLAAIHTVFQSQLRRDTLDALELAKTQYAFAKEKAHQYWIGKSANNLGRTYQKMGNYEESLSYYLVSLAINQTLQNAKGIAVVSRNIAKLHLKSFNNISKAIEYQEICLQASKATNDKKYQVRHFYNLGDMYRIHLNFSGALRQYLNGIEISQKEGWSLNLLTGYQKVANFYDHLEDFETAMLYHRKALKISKDIDNKKAIAYCYNNFGNIFHHQEKLDSALFFYQKSLELKEEINDSISIAKTYHNIGNVYFAQNDLKKTEEYYYLSLKKQEKIKNNRDLSNLYCALGELEIAYANYEKAVGWCDKGFKLAQKIQQVDRQIINCQCLALAYEGWSKEPNALHFQKIVTELQDSFKQVSNYLKVSQLETEYRLNKEKKEWLLNQASHQNKFLKSKFFWSILFISAVLLILWQIKRKKKVTSVNKAPYSNEVQKNPNTPSEILTQNEATTIWLDQVDMLIEKSISKQQNIKVTDLAALLFLSDRQLRRKLTQLTGVTPNKYIIEYKLKKARQLLEQRSYPTVKEVMYHAGFKHKSYFSKLYLERFGVLPSSYF